MSVAEAEPGVVAVEPLITQGRAIDIPYAFARKFGVVLLGDTGGSELAVALREGADPRALYRARRQNRLRVRYRWPERAFGNCSIKFRRDRPGAGHPRFLPRKIYSDDDLTA